MQREENEFEWLNGDTKDSYMQVNGSLHARFTRKKFHNDVKIGTTLVEACCRMGGGVALTTAKRGQSAANDYLSASGSRIIVSPIAT